ncbi:UNVERIFIED_CONTAM: hypothetical protein Sradi_5228700 [Sesamum radiatum]|uniref:Integrase zinc-binding domain-containing protein n=1 Tax=Sesamum radiatum TaxID=300843 RepID=A0AAW2LLU3_SESRA
MREVHEGSYGNHSRGRSLAGKVLQQGYFWPSIQKDALDMVRRCKKCQEHANIAHIPATPIQSIPNPCPFDKWGMDLARRGEAKGNLVNELPRVLWAYRTTARKSTGKSPFNLVYGTEAVIPAEIREETLRIQQYKSETNDMERRVDLELLGEIRNTAGIRTEAYRRYMAKVYNTRVRPRNFQIGDLVWRRSDVQGNIGKLDAKWEGPYRVAEIIGNASYKLKKLDGREVPRTWNATNLQNFYA